LKNHSTFSHDFRKAALKKMIRQSSKLSRARLIDLVPDLFALVRSAVPEARHQYMADRFALAILNVGEWWH
jgi:hypothetical protein